MRWAGNVARMEERCIQFWWGNLRESDHLVDPNVYGWLYYDGSSGSGLWGHGLDRDGSG
jgi:hypothetical protein